MTSCATHNRDHSPPDRITTWTNAPPFVSNIRSVSPGRTLRSPQAPVRTSRSTAPVQPLHCDRRRTRVVHERTLALDRFFLACGTVTPCNAFPLQRLTWHTAHAPGCECSSSRCSLSRRPQWRWGSARSQPCSRTWAPTTSADFSQSARQLRRCWSASSCGTGVGLQRRHPHRTTLTLDGWGATERAEATTFARRSHGRRRPCTSSACDSRTLPGVTSVRSADSSPCAIHSGHVVYCGSRGQGCALSGDTRDPVGRFAGGLPISVKMDEQQLLYPFDRAGNSSRKSPRSRRPWYARRGRAACSRPRDGRLALAGGASLSRGVTAPASLDDSNLRQPVEVLRSLIATVFALLRALRPWNESQTLRKSALTFREAPAFDLAGASEGSLTAATDATGARIELDLSAVQHPDAALATRTTRVFAVVDAAGGGAYRDGAIRVTAVETACDRARALGHPARADLESRSPRVSRFAAFAFVDVASCGTQT